jgi:hypothetical protein
MAFLKNKALILAKVESGYGNDATPVPGTDAILSSVPEFEYMSKVLERDNIKQKMGALTALNVGEGMKITFTTEFKGDGSAVDTPPEIGPLFRGCNFTQNINGGTSVVYAPNSLIDTAESLSIYFYAHDRLHKILGARGTFDIDLKAREFGKINWEFTGIYSGVTEPNYPGSITFNTTQPPVFKSAAFLFDTYSAELETLSFAINNEVAMRGSANEATGIKEYFVKDRAVSGEFDPLVVAIATKDFEDIWENSTQKVLQAKVGTASMNRCTIDAPAVQIEDLKYGDRENLLIHTATMRLLASSGDDEISFTFN